MTLCVLEWLGAYPEAPKEDRLNDSFPPTCVRDCLCKKCNLSVQAQREHIWIRWFRFDLILASGVDFAKIAATAGAACGLCFAESMGIGGVQVDCWNQAFQTPACD